MYSEFASVNERSAPSLKLFGSTGYRSTERSSNRHRYNGVGTTGFREFRRGTSHYPLKPRILFLDDAPDRAAVFLAGHQGAVWVQTAEQCLELLKQPWDEVHLDHDLGGEVLVDHERDDCGLAVSAGSAKSLARTCGTRVLSFIPTTRMRPV